MTEQTQVQGDAETLCSSSATTTVSAATTNEALSGDAPTTIQKYACHYDASITFPFERYATIVARALSTDDELRPDHVRREIQVEGTVLRLRMDATDIRSLRTSVTSLYDFMRVSIEAVAMFSSD